MGDAFFTVSGVGDVAVLTCWGLLEVGWLWGLHGWCDVFKRPRFFSCVDDGRNGGSRNDVIWPVEGGKAEGLDSSSSFYSRGGSDILYEILG